MISIFDGLPFIIFFKFNEKIKAHETQRVFLIDLFKGEIRLAHGLLAHSFQIVGVADKSLNILMFSSHCIF